MTDVGLASASSPHRESRGSTNREIVSQEEARPGLFSRVMRMLSWKPTSREELRLAEQAIFSRLQIGYDARFVPISDNNRLRTISLNTTSTSQQLPLVMIHGFASGIALWVKNFPSLSSHRPVYAFDILGFARSSRPHFPTDAEQIEERFVESINEWATAMGLNKFILLGHSFGAYLASAYALRHPHHLHTLILCDPWGFPERPPPNETEIRLPTWIRVMVTALQPFNPLAGLRFLGPWGPGLIQRFRPDLQRKFLSVVDDQSIFDYVYHCNAQQPTGEAAFKNLTIPFGWAKKPMISRVENISKDLPIYLIYGSRSWVDSGTGFKVRYLRHDCEVHIEIIKGAGHHVYADKSDEFNNLINKICNRVDPILTAPGSGVAEEDDDMDEYSVDGD